MIKHDRLLRKADCKHHLITDEPRQTDKWTLPNALFPWSSINLPQEVKKDIPEFQSISNPFGTGGTCMYQQRAKNSNFSDFDDAWQSSCMVSPAIETMLFSLIGHSLAYFNPLLTKESTLDKSHDLCVILIK